MNQSKQSATVLVLAGFGLFLACPVTVAQQRGLAQETRVTRSFGHEDPSTSFSSSALGDPAVSVSLIPIGNDKDGNLDAGVVVYGNEMTMESGGRRVYLEVRISDWDPEDNGQALRAYQFVVDAGGYSNSFLPMLARASVPCDGDSQVEADGVCAEAFGAGSRCDASYAGCDFGTPGQCSCTGAFIDTTRPGFVFAGASPLCATDLATDDSRAGCVLIVGQQSPPDPFPGAGAYAGTVVLDVPEDARGTFTIQFAPPPITNLVDQNNLVIPLIRLLPAKITIPVGRCCFDLEGSAGCVDGVKPFECDRRSGPRVFSLNESCTDGPTTCQSDCNENGVPDVVDLSDGAAADCDSNGVLDACETIGCHAVDTPVADAAQNPRSRYLSVQSQNAGCNVALRVTFDTMPEGFEFLEGLSMWAGLPRAICEHHSQTFPPPEGCHPAPGLPSRSFFAAELQCEPHYANFGARGTTHLFHEALVPGATYTVEAVHEGCADALDGHFSAPFLTSTGVWGDVAGPFDPTTGRWTGPDGHVDITTDVVSMLQKFANLSGAPITASSDVAPARPDGRVDMTVDIVWVIDAFRGVEYPFSSADPCP